MAIQTIHINEDNLIRIDLLRLSSNNNYVNSGTLSWNLKDSDDVSLGTGSLTYVSGTNGRWHGAIPSTVTDGLTEGAIYYLEVTMANEDGADGFRRLELVAGYHQE